MVSNAVDPTEQGVTMGALNSINSIMSRRRTVDRRAAACAGQRDAAVGLAHRRDLLCQRGAATRGLADGATAFRGAPYRRRNMSASMHCKILILDFGAQYTQLIARRVRENSIPIARSIRTMCRPSFDCRVCAGRHCSFRRPGERDCRRHAARARRRYGRPACRCWAFATACRRWRHNWAATVENGLTREFGYAAVRARGHGRLLDGIQDRSGTDGHGLLDVWMSHGDKVISLPPGFALMASNEATPIAAMMDESRRFYGVQFHPEVTHTGKARPSCSGSCATICGCPATGRCRPTSTRRSRRSGRKSVNDEVILGLSGGVDSSVAAALIHRAIGHAADLHIRRHRAAARQARQRR